MLIKPEHMPAFARVSTETRFKEWLNHERDIAIKTLKTAEATQFARAQGRLQFIDELLDVLEKARTN